VFYLSAETRRLARAYFKKISIEEKKPTLADMHEKEFRNIYTQIFGYAEHDLLLRLGELEEKIFHIEKKYKGKLKPAEIYLSIHSVFLKLREEALEAYIKSRLEGSVQEQAFDTALKPIMQLLEVASRDHLSYLFHRRVRRKLEERVKSK
jgi:hypothetical protein